MLSNQDINHLFTFPIKDRETLNKFLMGAVVSVLAFIIPIIPMLLLAGYSARIVRQVLDGQKPSMPAWDDWDGMFKDGARIFGIRMIYASPLLLVFLILFGAMSILPFIADMSGNSSEEVFFITFFVIMFGSMVLIMPFSLLLGIVLPAAEIHTIANNEFAAGFRIREWWPIFRSNWGGFLLALAFSYIISFGFTLVMQLLMLTFILACLLPIIMPVFTFYMSVVMYAAFAQAYRDGLSRLATKSNEPAPPTTLAKATDAE